MSFGLSAEKFNIVINDHGRTYKCHFPVFDWKFSFWANLVKRNQSCQFKLKFGNQSNLNMQNSMVVLVFTFSVLDRKHPFCANLVQKSKLSVSAEIWCIEQFKYAEFNGGVHFFCFRRETLLGANLVQKLNIVSLSRNLVPRLILKCRIQWWCSLFLFQTGNALFKQIWSKKSKLSA